MSVPLFLKTNWCRAKRLLAEIYPPLVIFTAVSCSGQFFGASDIADTKPPDGRKIFGSVNVTINVGQTEGKFAGKLLYWHDVLDAKSYDPNALMLSLNNGASVVRTPDGTPRQITTNEALTDIVPVSGGFEVRFYQAEAVTEPKSDAPDALYAIHGNPTCVWRIRNPDFDPKRGHAIVNRVEILRTPSGEPATRMLFTLHDGNAWLLEEQRMENGVLVDTHRVLRRPTTILIPGQPAPLPAELKTELTYLSGGKVESVTTTAFCDEVPQPWSGRISSIVGADGREERISYSIGGYDSATHRFDPAGSGFVRTETISNVDPLSGTPAVESIRQILINDAAGHTVFAETSVHDGTTFRREDQAWHEFDRDGKRTRSTSNGRVIFDATQASGVQGAK